MWEILFKRWAYEEEELGLWQWFEVDARETVSQAASGTYFGSDWQGAYPTYRV